MKTSSAPELGAVGWLVFDPQAGREQAGREQAGREQAGREQAGRRPAIVLSHTRYNAKTGLAVFCPITSRVKGYPFELALPEKLSVDGVVLCDQVRSLDWRERSWQAVGSVSQEFLREVMARMAVLFDWGEE